MITTVTMNPCIDKTVWVDGFICGGTNRVAVTRTDLAAVSFGLSENAEWLARCRRVWLLSL